MPKYIDFHAKMPSIPPEVIEETRQHLGEKDKFGVANVGAYFTKDGQGYCITDAPNVDAVCKAHEAKGLKLGKGDVHEISSAFP